MATVFATITPLGRLYDPLLQLAARVQDALSRRRQTVWVDGRGGVFLNDADLLQSISPTSIVGTYDFRTPLFVIEGDLRLALRERASHWILDWNAQTQVPRAMEIGMMPRKKPRRRARNLAPASDRVPGLIA
jgi:hypothetical protein